MMQKYFVLISFIFSSLLAQEIVKLNPNPIKENGVKFEEEQTIMADDGFYDRTLASISPNGNVVVADAGNKVVHIYNKNYMPILTFGKEGKGPGEIDRIGTLKATKSRIFVGSFQRLIIFDYSGKFINEVNLMQYGSSRHVITDQGVMLYFTAGNPKYSAVYFDNNGEEIKKLDNAEYEEPKEQAGGMRMIMITGNGYFPYKDGFINSHKGEYGIEFIGQDLKVNTIYTRSFTRVPRNMDNFQFSFKAEGVSKKEQDRMRQAAQKQMMAQLGEFIDDVSSILGVVNGYIFVRTANEDDKTLSIDVISPDMKYYTSAAISGEDFENVRIEENKLIMNYKNDDDGPYVKIYKINLI